MLFGFNPFYVGKKKLNIVRRTYSFQEDEDELKKFFIYKFCGKSFYYEVFQELNHICLELVM
jgi:hypothetical protein